MTREKYLMETFVSLRGWRKVKGFRIDKEEMGGDDFEVLYFEGKLKDLEFIRRCYYWTCDDEFERPPFEEVEEIIDYIEDDEGENVFEEWKKKRLEVKSQKKLTEVKP